MTHSSGVIYYVVMYLFRSSVCMYQTVIVLPDCNIWIKLSHFIDYHLQSYNDPGYVI